MTGPGDSARSAAALAAAGGLMQVLAPEALLVSARGETLAGTADPVARGWDRLISSPGWSALWESLADGTPARHGDALCQRLLSPPELTGAVVIRPVPADDAGELNRRSHDLRAGLQSLLLALSSPSASPRQLTALTQDLLSQIEMILMPDAAQDFELVHEVSTLLTALQPLLQSCGTEVVTELPPAPVWLHGRRAALLRLVQNLVMNAARHSGSPRAEIVLQAGPVDDTGLRAVELRVKDGGAGPDAQAIAWLEGRSRTAPLPRADGHGLGLSIIRQAAGDLEGALRVDLSEGNTISLTCRMPTAAPPQALPDVDLNRQQIWVAEDDPVTAGLLASLLRTAGAEVFLSASGEDFPRDTGWPDLLICDQYLQGTTGVALLRELRAAGFDGPALGISGDSRQAAPDFSEIFWLQKPLSPARLLQEISRLLADPLDPQIVAELLDTLGEASTGFMNRALSQVRDLMQTQAEADYESLRGPLHSVIGACAMTGLHHLETNLRDWQSSLRRNKNPLSQRNQIIASIGTTRRAIARLTMKTVQE